MTVSAGNKIRNEQSPLTEYGTVGGIVMYNNKPHLLTCFHCVHTGNMSWDDTNPDVDKSVSYATEPNVKGMIIRTERNNLYDLGLIAIDPADAYNKTIFNWGKVNDLKYLTDSDINNLSLRKYGATTADTYGTYRGIEEHKAVQYPYEQNLHFFDTLIRISTNNGTPFSKEGDSGAFILDSSNNLVGMLLMGNDDFSYAIPMSSIKLFMDLNFIL